MSSFFFFLFLSQSIRFSRGTSSIQYYGIRHGTPPRRMANFSLKTTDFYTKSLDKRKRLWYSNSGKKSIYEESSYDLQ